MVLVSSVFCTHRHGSQLLSSLRNKKQFKGRRASSVQGDPFLHGERGLEAEGGLTGHTEFTVRKQSEQEVGTSYQISRPAPLVCHFL